MADTFRALCAELVADYDDCHYRSELSDRAHAALAQPQPVAPTDEALLEFIEQVQRAQHVAIREGECPRFDLVECALAFCRETIPPSPKDWDTIRRALEALPND